MATSLALGVTAWLPHEPAQAAQPLQKQQAVKKALATVKVRQPARVARNARKVVLTGSVQGKHRGKLKLQQRTSSGWRTLTTVRATRTWKKSVRIERTPTTFRAVVGTTRGPVASNRVTVKAARPTKAAAFPAVDQFDPQRLEVLRATNDFRAKHGLRPLKPMRALNTIATNWTRKMAASGTMTHNPNYWRNYPAGWRAGAENIGYGYGPTGMVRSWRNSPGHRKNLLGNYTHIGIGVARDSDGRLWYTQDFARY